MIDEVTPLPVWFARPPPPRDVLKVILLVETLRLPKLNIPPPVRCAVFPVIFEPTTFSVPTL